MLYGISISGIQHVDSRILQVQKARREHNEQYAKQRLEGGPSAKVRNPTYTPKCTSLIYIQGKGKPTASDNESVDSMMMDLDDDDDDFEKQPIKKTSKATSSKAKAPAKKAPARRGKKAVVSMYSLKNLTMRLTI